MKVCVTVYRTMAAYLGWSVSVIVIAMQPTGLSVFFTRFTRVKLLRLRALEFDG